MKHQTKQDKLYRQGSTAPHGAIPWPAPFFLYGTAWKEDRTADCVRRALEVGFRGIDTANQRKHYFEKAVGEALVRAYSEGIVRREELFLQTKFTFLGGQDHRLPYDPEAPVEKQVLQSFHSSAEHLSTDYLDSYVLHGPTSGHGLGDEDWQAWRAMEDLAQNGRVRALGVSNVSVDQLNLLYEGAAVKPSYVQNRCFARTGWDAAVREYCKKTDIIYQGFSLLTANIHVLNDQRPNSPVNEIVRRVGCTPAQAVFAFCRHVGMLPLTGSTSAEHLRQDLATQYLELTESEVAGFLA